MSPAMQKRTSIEFLLLSEYTQVHRLLTAIRFWSLSLQNSFKNKHNFSDTGFISVLRKKTGTNLPSCRY
jgi:hypothetical protein